MGSGRTNLFAVDKHCVFFNFSVVLLGNKKINLVAQEKANKTYWKYIINY